MKLSKLIEKLEKIKLKYGDLPIGHMTRQGYNRVTNNAVNVEVTVKTPKTNPRVVIETYGDNGWSV